MAIHKARLENLNVTYLNRENILSSLEKLFEKYDDAFERAQYHNCFLAGGLSFEFRSNHNHYLTFIENTLNTDITASQNSARILCACFGENNLPNFFWSDEHLDVLGLDAMLKNTPFRLHIDPQYQIYSIFNRQMKCGIQLSRNPNFYPPWESSGPLRIFIHWYLASVGISLVHAGTLGIRNTGALFAGPGGIGKSSTVVSGIMNGLQSVGDDYVSVEIREKIILRPVYNIVKINPERLEKMGGSSNRTVNWQNKVEIKFSEFQNFTHTEFIEAKILCLPKVSNLNKTRFIQTSSNHGFLTLAPSGLAQLPGERDFLFRACAEISRRLPCYILELGLDSNEISDAIETFISRIEN